MWSAPQQSVEEGKTTDTANTPSALKASRVPLDDDVELDMRYLHDFINAKRTAPSVGVNGYVEPIKSNRYGSNRIVFRSCYRHMLPIINSMMDNGQTVAVSGTPGIGKTLLGLFLLQLFVYQGNSVVYWNKDRAILFTRDKNLIERFGLEDNCSLNGKEWHWGAWKEDERNLRMFLVRDDVVVIHDPAQGYIEGGKRPDATRVIYILSFGHELNAEWHTKREGAPQRELTMPVFDLEEIKANKNNLFYGMNWTDGDIERKYDRFGGSIRFWGSSVETRHGRS